MKVHIHRKRKSYKRRISSRMSPIEIAYAKANHTLTKDITDQAKYNLRSLTDNELMQVYTMAQNFGRNDFVRVLRRIMDGRGIDTFPHSF